MGLDGTGWWWRLNKFEVIFMCLFGINYELEKGTTSGFRNVCGSSGSPPHVLFGLYVYSAAAPPSIPESCYPPVILAGSVCRLPERNANCSRRHGNGEPGQSSAPEMKLLPRSGQSWQTHSPLWSLNFSLLHSQFAIKIEIRKVSCLQFLVSPSWP